MRSSAAGSATRSTWISKSRAQIVTSSPSPSPPASWNACATCDSPGPKKRSVRRSGGVPRSSTVRTDVDLERLRPEPLQLARRARQDDHRRPVRVDDEAGRGAGEPEAGRARGHASPACARPPRSRRTAASAAPRPCARSLRSGLPAPSSTCSSRPATFATISTVRSSCVGPSPPEQATRSAEASASRSAVSSSPGSSPTISIRAGSSPSASSERARNGPFRSVRSPRTSSLPVTTITARGRPAPGLNWRRRRRSSSPSRRRPAP